MTEYKSRVKYEAPIEINIEEDLPDLGSMAVSEIENMIFSAVLKVGITVDKEELIKALRYDRGQYEKGYADGKRDAAAAIEALDCLLDQNTQRCEALRKQLREAHESYERHINELEAQLPKRGKWIPIQIGKWRGHKCSCCGIAREVPCSSSDGIPQWKYCPECGAKMEPPKEDADGNK